MALSNPFLGTIPIPDPITGQVPVSFFPPPIVGANVITTRINVAKSYSLTLPTQANTYHTHITEEFILTSIYISRFFDSNSKAAISSSSVVLTLNDLDIGSWYDYINIAGDSINLTYNIPVDNWRIPANSYLQAVQSSPDGNIGSRGAYIVLVGYIEGRQ
jgi:hypothetical protein